MDATRGQLGQLPFDPTRQDVRALAAAEHEHQPTSRGEAQRLARDVAGGGPDLGTDRETRVVLAGGGHAVQPDAGRKMDGPGEAREADLGIAAGNKRGHLFVKGRNVAVVPEREMVEALVEWAEFINEHGTDAAIARADTKLAEREAARDRSHLMDEQGDDANNSAEKIVEIRKTIGR